MGLGVSILGLLFLIGILLFTFVLIVTAFSLKGRGGLSGRPILTAFAFAVAIALMAGPVLTVQMNESYAPGHAFRLFFGRPPVDTIKILNHRAGAGPDYSEVMLKIQTSSASEFDTFASYAQLRRAKDSVAPGTGTNDLPEWWRPEGCAGDLAVYRGRPDASWDEKWALFCNADNTAFAYAIWIK